jgi:deoxycytidylate deaminase
MIVNARSIKEVFYRNEYPADLKGVEILNNRGICCRKIPKEK